MMTQVVLIGFLFYSPNMRGDLNRAQPTVDGGSGDSHTLDMTKCEGSFAGP